MKDTSGANGPDEPEAVTEIHDLALQAAPTVQWSVDAGGIFTFDGPVGVVLGLAAGSDLAAELHAVLAPILVVMATDPGWEDYQLERTYAGPNGPRHLMIHCRQRQEAAGGHVGAIMNRADHQRDDENLSDLIDRYRLLVEISPDGIVVHQDGVVRYINPTGLAWMAADEASDMVGQPFGQFVEASSIGPLMQRIAQLERPGDVSSPSDMTIITLDGRHLLLEAQSARTTWDGKPAFQVFLRDHSAQRRAEAALRYQASLLESVSDAVLATDLDGRITGWNPAAAKLYKRSGPEAMGRRITDLLGDDSITPTGEIRAGEVEHQCHDGRPIPVRVSVAPLRDDIGRSSGEVAVCADQSYRLLAVRERRVAESRFTTVVSALSEGIIVMESDGRISSINPAAGALFGGAAAEGGNLVLLLEARSLLDAGGNALALGQDPASLALATGEAQRDRLLGFDDGDGRRHWWSVNCESLERRAGGETASTLFSITDVTDRRASERRLTYAAAHDSLTGLGNRTQVLDVLDRCVTAGLAAAVLFVDLDRFKATNDTHGHIAGDRVLRCVASRMLGLVGASGTVGRLAGDEFVVVLPGASEATAVGVAERILDQIALPIPVHDGRAMVLTASIGVARTAANEASAEALLGDADLAMYRAKQRGRACVAVFDAALRAARSRRLLIADRLRQAVTDRTVEVHFQPIVRFDTGRTVGYEALARWIHGDLGPVEPAEFIPVAEDNGLIVALGRHVLVESCRQASTWDTPPGGTAPIVSVNLSAHQLADPQLPADVIAAVTVSGLAAERLCLEVTESVLMDDVTTSIAVLSELRAAGVRIVIDDFGTGYSSLSYLRRLPVDGIKIDQSFVAGLGHASEDNAIVSAIVQLGHSLGLTLTAEGVETPEQAGMLRRMGCDTAQGYLFGRPAPAGATLSRTSVEADATGRPDTDTPGVRRATAGRR
jgi:diguanylate cyclase (GGDEF)-like protein/PAS domain S-box-containing protein